ncbi:MAG: recombinase family protein [Lachnospiraceae bacterium]|nr:recombinase family protein [Lachnospiraceae bacterium]
MKQLNNNTALYMRLSRDDENFGDSVSIETQRTILNQFVKENGLHVVDEYVDDGYSGTNFERPAFKRMIEDVEAGRVNCIITKDLSRFGREHIMMGYYLEFYFVDKNVRYIAVSEGEDTEKGLSDFVPFKNLFNEWFAKDTSRKIKTCMNAKFLAGERTFAYAPLGYKRDEHTKNKLAIDDETKWIIEKIYSYALLGNGANRITKMLIAEKIPTPGYINFKRNGTFANIYADAPPEKSYAWTIAQVKSILKDETYIGNTVHYRETNVSYKNKHRVRKDKSEWLIVKGTHEGIISYDDFSTVQQMIATRRRTNSFDGTNQIFAGLVKCADCRWSMSYSHNTSVKVPYYYYKCSRYSLYGKKHCTNHHIRYDTLYAYVLSRLQFWVGQAKTDEEKLLKKMLAVTEKESVNTHKKQDNALKAAEKRKKEIDGLFVRLYEDFVAERITEYNFNMLSGKYQTEQAELEQTIDGLKKELALIKSNETNAEKWLTLIKQYDDISELTAPLLNALIEKIAVHQAVKKDDGTTEQEVEIYYRFIGKID